MTRAAAKLLSQLLALGEALRGRGVAELGLRLLRSLFGKKQRQRRPFVLGEGEDRHAVVAVEPGGVGEPGGEEVRRTLVGHVCQVAAAEPAAGAEVAPGVTGQAAERQKELLTRLGRWLGPGFLLLRLLLRRRRRCRGGPSGLACRQQP